jgi:hypothetical protein
MVNEELYKGGMVMGLSEEEKLILGRIDRKVRFKYPKPEPHFQGILRDRCVMYAPSWTGVPYWDVVDLIEFIEPKKFKVLRFGYYRKSKGRLIWASQTTLTEPMETFKALFKKAVKEKEWFKRFLEDVLKEADESS